MKTLRGKFISLFVTLIVVSILGGGFVVNTISKQKADGVVINLAGRQRMLSQKFTKEFLEELNIRQIAAASEQLTSVATMQIKSDRGYYTKNIIGKLKREWSGFKGRVNYNEVNGAIPLPATFVREVSESLDKSANYHYDLISKYNINKKRGLSSEFEQRAWDSLSKDPKTPYSEFISQGGGVEKRYATADVANVQGCVSCHNNHPNSPKTDFKLGDLMGILIVSTPVTQDPEIGRLLLNLGSKKTAGVRASEKTRKLFGITMKALSEGTATYADLAMTKPITISATSNPKIRTQLTKIDKLWKDLQNAVNKVMAEKVNSSSYLKELKSVRLLSVSVLKNMNAAVGMYEAETMTKMERLNMIQVVVVGIVILVIVVGWFLVVNPLVKLLSNLSGELFEGANQISSASNQISSSSQSLASGATQQASSLEETSASLEQIASMTRQNADNANTANSLMEESRKMVDNGVHSMEEMVAAMDSIKDSSGEISKIIKVIEEIAFQTNLLALNAAVEAARAGEHGKGFAVVAEEVRNLAQRSAAASKDTASLIENAVKKADEGGLIVEGSSKALNAIAESSKKVGDLVSEIASASNEQSSGIDQVNKAVGQMDKITQSNAAGAEESAAASEELNAQAESLNRVVQDLLQIVNGSKSGNSSRKVILVR